MAKITVIMPSYNVAPYIRECMDSVLSQSLTDLEILCVDAGSEDGTFEILQSYAQQDSRIRLIRSEKKSYGYQMNLGLGEACGEYIGIVETDDYIESRMYEELYACAKENDADFVKADFDAFTTIAGEGRVFLRYFVAKGSSAAYNRLFSTQDYMDSRQSIDVFIWNGIYKRSFLEQHHIGFQETPGAAFQDCGFRYLVALYVKRGYFLRKSFYRYRRDNIGSSTYDNRCMLFNYGECAHLLEEVRGRADISDAQMRFLAKEMAVIAYRPCVALHVWGEPAEGTGEALEGFGRILREMMDEGHLRREMMEEELWVAARLLTLDFKAFATYVRVQAEILSETIRGFLKKVARAKEIVVFGGGYVGASILCLLHNNGVSNIRAFCDSDQERWGSTYRGLPLLSPKEAVDRFKEAYFIVGNESHGGEMRLQLHDLGVPESRTMIYGLHIGTLECVSMTMRFLD